MKRVVLPHITTVLGLLFVYSGIFKLLYPGEAALALESLEFGHEPAKLVVTAVTIMELYLGIILCFKIDLRYGLIVATGLVFVFAVFLCYLSTLAHPPKCGCLGLTGLFRSNRHAALFGLFRNCVILWALKLSYDYHFKAPEPAGPKTPGTVSARPNTG